MSQSSVANKALARRYLELISAGDADGVANVFTEDGAILVQSDTLFPPEVRGRAAIRVLMSHLPEAFPDTGLRIYIDVLTAEDDRVCLTAHTDAIHVSGKAYRNRYHFLLYFENGKIKASHEYLDSLLLNNILSAGGRKL